MIEKILLEVESLEFKADDLESEGEDESNASAHGFEGSFINCPIQKPLKFKAPVIASL